MFREVKEIKFSHDSGFYDEAFDLTLSSDSGRIFYTQDISKPDETKDLYVEPIRISDATEKENTVSSITEVVPYFNEEVIGNVKHFDYPYSIPDYYVDKANVIKAYAIDNQGLMSNVSTKVYFVGFQEKLGYDGMNIVSINADPYDLFDYEDGVFVTGSLLDEWYAQQDPLPSSNYVEGGNANHMEIGRAHV